ncbi:MAG TPA: transposase [Actinocrinis sp.]|nr:transposase [Actinocrinis sp.]
MSLWPRDPREVPAQTARVARAVVPGGSFCLRLRDTLGVVFRDEAFADLFVVRGRPAEAPGRLALVSVLQFVEGLTDRQAADAVRLRLDWKYLLGLELEDQGFDASVLCEFRARLAASGAAEALLFDAVLSRLAEADLVARGGRQRTDSTMVLAQIRSLHRLELVGETLRAALEAVAACAPGWLRQVAPPAWFTRYGPRVQAYRLPKSASERMAPAEQVGRDGVELFERCRQGDAPLFLRDLPALQALRAIWVQQFYRDESALVWRDRETHGRPPGARAIISPYDLDARFSVKRGVGWDGYKVQISESCDSELPHLITYVGTVPATEPDIASTSRVHQRLAERGLTPAEHLVDAAYVAADQILAARQDHGVDLVGPLTVGHSWQKKHSSGFALSSFAVDWDRQIVTCPQGPEQREPVLPGDVTAQIAGPAKRPVGCNPLRHQYV